MKLRPRVTGKPIWACRKIPIPSLKTLFEAKWLGFDRAIPHLLIGLHLPTLLTILILHYIYLWYLLFLCKQVRKSLEKSKQMLEK